MVLDTKCQTFDLKQIQNRRFMYSSKYHTLILGDSKAGREMTGSHAKEFHQVEVKGVYDNYIKGWIGRNSTDYRQGIVHFAPPLYIGNFDEGISFFHMLTKVKGFGKNCKVRGFKNIPECSINELLPSLFN